MLTSLTTACGDSSSADNGLTKVTLMLDWSPNTNHTGLYTAMELGYFENEGIELEIVEASEAGAEASVANGTVNFGISFQDYLIPAFSATEESILPITAIAAIIQHNTSGIISNADSNIKSPADMEGHNYATWEMEVEQAMIKEVVTSEGGDFDKIELIPMTVENIPGAFETGIDSIWTYYAWEVNQCVIEDVDFNFFFLADYADELDYYSPLIIASNDFLKENPDTVKAFMSAVTKGYEYAIENPDEAAEILVKANDGLDAELCKISQEWLADKYKDDSAKWGVIEQSRWDAFYNWAYENDVCEYKIPDGYGFSNEYLPE